MKRNTDLCQRLTDDIVTSLEAGTAPWRCPWDNSQVFNLPSNPSTGADYHGFNVLQLWSAQAERQYSTGHWLTYKQAQAAGGQVRKGEAGTPGVFYKVIEKDRGETDERGEPVLDRRAILRGFTVFNLDQIEGIEAPNTRPRYGFEPEATAEAVLAAAGVAIVHGGAGAYYQPGADRITLPDADRFASRCDYYATALHELTHATAHASRCDRPRYETDIKDGAYAFEELVAELGSLYTMAALGLSGSVVGHDSYISNWLAVLKDDKRAVLKAAAQAQAAHDWIINTYEARLAAAA